MPPPRVVAAAVSILIAVAAAGCSDTVDGTAEEQSTTSGRTQTVTVTSSKTVTAPPAIVLPASTDRAYFRTPSRNILCMIGGDVGDGPAVRCLLREASWPSPPPRPEDCEYDWIDTVIGIDDGAVGLGACLSDFPWGCIGSTPCDAVVPWDGSIAFGDRIRCTARRAGLECSDSSGEGFVVSREGYEITS